MSPRLKVVIAGGGLAGVLAAAVLRAQHDVIVLEKSSSTGEVGAAISIGPNGVKLLEQLGVDRARIKSVGIRRMRIWAASGELAENVEIDPAQEFGADWSLQHRADLHEEFLRLANEPSDALGIKGKPVEMLTGSKVEHVDVESGLVRLADGRQLESDLFIAADGVKSCLRPLIAGDMAYQSARPSGTSAFRFTIPASRLESANVQISVMDRTKPACFEVVFSFDSSDRSVVMYPCRDFELLNVVAIVLDESLKSRTTESWRATGDVQEMLDCFGDFPKWTQDVLRLADQKVNLWQLRDQDPLPTYIRGRAVLIGDAAHAMTPHQGQGATQAIEDAEGFKLFLKGNVTRSRVPALLELFDLVRRNRASKVQQLTREAMEVMTAQEVLSRLKSCWTYHGIEEELRLLNSSEAH